MAEMVPEHVSIYLIETDDAGKETPLTRAVRDGWETLPVEADLVTMYTEGIQRLVAAGYRHYEISNFCRPGRESIHNLKFWRSRPYLGVGPSAHSSVGCRRFSRPADLLGWIRWVSQSQIDAGNMVGREPSDGDYTLPHPEARAREALVLGLRLMEGVDLDEFKRRWHFDPESVLRGEIQGLISGGLLLYTGRGLSLTGKGLLLSNEVFSRLL